VVMRMKRIKNYIIILLLQILVIFTACEADRDKKIKLARAEDSQENHAQSVSSVLRIAPEEQSSIAILYFSNETNDPNLNWLDRGLTDMLVTELTQSPYLNVIPTNRLAEIAAKLGRSVLDLKNPTVALVVARETNAELTLSGRFYQQDGRITIDAELLDVKTGRLIRRETVSGQGMERIFAMVDELSDRVRRNLRGGSEDRQFASVNLAQMTTSLEAFRCYSMALENAEKFLHEEAERCLEDAIKADPTFAAGYLRLADIRFNMKKVNEAKEALEKTHQYIDKLSDADQSYLQILETQMSGEYRKLIPLLIDALNRYPSNVDLRLQLARYYRAFGNLDKALEEFEIAREIDPNRKIIYNDLAYTYAARGDFANAISYIDKYKELAPDEPNPYDSKGEILMWSGQLDQAIQQFQTALVKWPTFHYSARRLAQLYLDRGDINKTLKYIEYVDRLDYPADLPSRINYFKGLLYWKVGEIAKAEKLFKSAIEEEPLNFHLAIVLGEMYQSVGDSLAAKELFEKVFLRLKHKLDSNQGDSKAVSTLAQFALRVNLPSHEIIPILEKLAYKQKNPDLSTELNATIGVLFARSGQYEKAIPYFEEGNFALVNLIADDMTPDWGSVWKFISQSVSNAPKFDPSLEKLAQRLIEKARELDRKDLNYAAKFIQAHLYTLSAQEENLKKVYLSLGTPLEHSWYVVGPFPQKNISGFQNEFPPEKDSRVTTSYKVKRHELSWQRAKDSAYDGYLNLRDIFQPSSWAVAYGLLYISSPEERRVQIRVGSDETCKIWLNDELIWQHFIQEGALIDRDLVTVLLHPGYNKILLKVTNTDQEWGFYFRVTDEKGNGIPDIKFHSPAEVDQSLATHETSDLFVN